jgi:hypothetical protein
MKRYMHFIFLKEFKRKGESGNEISFKVVCPHPLSEEKRLEEFERLRQEYGIGRKEYSCMDCKSIGDPF